MAVEEQLSSAFLSKADHFQAIETIALAGSLGRLEAHQDSDFDCIIIANSNASDAQRRQQSALAVELMAECGLKMPKASGIFLKPVDRLQLLDRDALGKLDEAPHIYGKRMQCLLDTRAVYMPKAFTRLQADLVRWYASDFVEHRPRRSWTYLINELARYLHSYASWQQFKFDQGDDDSWLLRQLKLRSSRMVTFAGLLYLLGESNQRDDKLEWLGARLNQTPLERVLSAMLRYQFDGLERFVNAYQAVHTGLADSALRNALIQASPNDHAGAAGALPTASKVLWQDSDTVMRELTRFLLSRSNDWDPRFFARVLF